MTVPQRRPILHYARILVAAFPIQYGNLLGGQKVHLEIWIKNTALTQTNTMGGESNSYTQCQLTAAYTTGEESNSYSMPELTPRVERVIHTQCWLMAAYTMGGESNAYTMPAHRSSYHGWRVIRTQCRLTAAHITDGVSFVHNAGSRQLTSRVEGNSYTMPAQLTSRMENNSYTMPAHDSSRHGWRVIHTQCRLTDGE